jgi:hypothetical protein
MGKLRSQKRKKAFSDGMASDRSADHQILLAKELRGSCRDLSAKRYAIYTSNSEQL